jgi:S-adenosylmethionine:tRNA ribosyltransferase-isomerase
MIVDDFDYLLPPELIAQEAVEPRDHSRLLHLDPSTGEIEHLRFYELPRLLRPGDLLVLNDTRVTARRLEAVKTPTGARIEVVLTKRLDESRFIALCKPARRLKPKVSLLIEDRFEAEVLEALPDGTRILNVRNPDGIESAGQAPLPPYFHGHLPSEERYQTVYATTPGSAAAPTAGLHFTSRLLNEIRAAGIGVAFVSLEIGLDTFRPISTERIQDHKMHGETFCVPHETADAIAAATGRIIAVGTTTTRTLETAAIAHRRVQPGSGVSELFIAPGYRFRVVDGLITNFHMPRTTMLLLVSALAGVENLKKAYREAVQQRYRFLSLGDSMLVLRRENP